MVSDNISVIKIPRPFPRERARERESVLQPPPPLTLASKRFLFVLQTKGFSREGRGNVAGKMTGGEREREREEETARGGKQGRNYYIFCPKARIAPFAELRDRDSATIADAECRAGARRVAEAFVSFD